ncbi:hypothetical protein DNTS_018383, partial [Danionella cerebrum]
GNAPSYSTAAVRPLQPRRNTHSIRAETRGNQAVYSLPSCGGFRQPFTPSSLQSSSSYTRFSPSLMGIPHPAIVPPSAKQELQNFNLYPKSQGEVKREKEPKKPVIKKPLNAFMLYMKEMRAKVIAECTLKESAAINQILGRRWHALTREEQSKYYELARKERQLHMQLYPSWSARDNYTPALLRNAALASASTIRATGVAPAGITLLTVPRRKKKCIRFLQRGCCSSPPSSDGSHIDSSPSPGNHPESPTSPLSIPSSPCRSSAPLPKLSRIKTESFTPD